MKNSVSCLSNSKVWNAVRVMASMSLIPAAFFCLLALAQAGSPERVKPAMTASHWTVSQGGVEFVQHLGVDAIELKAGNYAQHIKTGEAVLNDVVFSNGTIEFDVDPTGSMGSGFGFRRRDKDTYEDFYLRPKPKCDEAPDCLQYAPQTHGVLLWDLYPQYQGPAPLHDGGWNHIKVVVSGLRMNIYVNGATTPTLHVGRLEGDVQEGGLVIQGPGFFANMTITPGAVEGLAAKPEMDATAGDARYVRYWQLSPLSELMAEKDPVLADMPPATAAWQPITAERGGLVNVSRVYGLPLPRPARGMVWLKTTIRSDRDQTKKVAMGWAREAWVYVNGKEVYADKNLYMPASARKNPDGRCSLENGGFELPLKKGDNEVAVAVDSNFYGLAVILRLDDVDGVHLAKK